MTDFILRTLVREVLRDSTIADPGTIADEVLRRIPRGAMRSALQQALRLYVRQVISEERISRANPGVPVATKPARSTKVTAIRDGWQRRLRDRVHTGKGEWKFLAACTYGDLLAAAAERRELADRNSAWARTYDAWARLLPKYGVSTFGDLPVEALAAALGRAA